MARPLQTLIRTVGVALLDVRLIPVVCSGGATHMLTVRLSQSEYVLYHQALSEVWQETDKDLAPFAHQLFVHCCKMRVA